ncbi:SUN domain-containing protein 4-like [Papaver somniferum]|uniref:SUN domain-containing protein 4-like n=1 Tax=Papaver somniferum TaxID=3469 RepID=UPI000E6F9F10|nr:SUN domain-containing protein 4-like [Papaver somniferum]XP_026454156.1 SUN domain-containing protein 4-like [Papaver somniferum]XP_026454157.1 SUN domain-containing protein 4-like [Papaver somniferum]XP_026454158.1 SUN domain-containing protein 4-like [Papaver somniferum]
MQKASRKALLNQRRASSSSSNGKTTTATRHLYKVSLSLLLIWWLFFPVLIGHSGDTNNNDNYTDKSGAEVEEHTLDEATEQVVSERSDSGTTDILYVSAVSTKDSDLDTCTDTTSSDTQLLTSGELLAIGKNENDQESVKEKEKLEVVDLGEKVVEKEFTSGGSVTIEKNENAQESGKDKEKLEVVDLGQKVVEKELNLKLNNNNNDRLSRAAPLGLDEFKSKQLSIPKGKPVNGLSRCGVVHRKEAGGTEYNYASASKGAKVLDFNKEAKGASHILGKDKDKYLRNPCSAEVKFVVIELSEETLVDTIEVANFEHHASNLRDFEVLGSSVYPTDKWVSLGNITARNAKHVQRFDLEEPKWVRYVKFNLLNHYGYEFYCTLSAVGVYGMDAVEQMVEDLISVNDNHLGSEEVIVGPAPTPPQPEEPAQGDGWDFDNESVAESANSRPDVPKSNVRNPVPDDKPQQVGRMTGDTALKILLQKVRSMDLSLSVLERYLEELNSRYGNIFKELDDEIAAKDVLLDKYREDIKNLADSKEVMAKNVADLIGWKSLVSSQISNLVDDNVILRSEVERVLKNQSSMENKGVVILLVSFIFGCIALSKIIIELVFNLLRIQKSGKFTVTSSSLWLVLLLSCSIVVIILL